MSHITALQKTKQMMNFSFLLNVKIEIQHNYSREGKIKEKLKWDDNKTKQNKTTRENGRRNGYSNCYRRISRRVWNVSIPPTIVKKIKIQWKSIIIDRQA